ILQGIEKEGMPKPISQDAQCIKEFLIRSPVIMIEIYKEFKQVYTSNLPQKESIYNNLFKDVLQIKKDIIAGELSKEYDKNLVIAILYSVFTPEATIDRSQYELLLGRRQDRQNDIPAVLNKLSSLKVRISKGGFMLKGELDTSPWSMLAEVVFEVNNNKVEVIPEKLGIELLKEYTEGTLQGKRKDFLRLIYAFDMNNGNTLPNFSSNYEVLSKHMEFVGDRMQNDIIHQLLSKAQQSYPEEFSRMKEDKSAAYSGLAKTLFQLWNSNIGDKKQRIIAILQKNGFNVDFINWRQDISSQEIAAWLSELSSNVIQKSFIQRIFNALYGEEYARMKNEIGKFEFRREGKSLFGNPFQFVLSKKRLHCVAMFNFGVCVAPDDKLWNSEDFWQMIIFDEENKACGGVIYRTVIEDEKKYLIASIQPSSTVLSSFSPTKIYDKIIQFSRIIAKRLGYSNLLIPATSAIHSNRGSIQQEISARNYPRIKLSKTYEFSYSPYHYTYNEFFIAG
ncbi:MAG: hypothetical protein Q8R04_03535, partial [Nanoarchaeota archaeon]|nr:hypothetical protein [Nanoarchaeota archaeon]